MKIIPGVLNTCRMKRCHQILCISAVLLYISSSYTLTRKPLTYSTGVVWTKHTKRYMNYKAVKKLAENVDRIGSILTLISIYFRHFCSLRAEV